ncbi:MAG: prolipoprotein diacylglyceryl transferase family protein [Candidatus Sericytochromatia bacterium]
MNFPINFYLFGFEIESHFIFEVLAYTLGFKYYSYLRKKEKDLIADSDRLWIFIGAVFGGLIFSRLLSALEDFPTFINTSTPLYYYYSNKTILGGLLGGLLGVELTKKLIKVKTSSGDLMTFPLILGIIIGRIGCFLKGLEDGTFGTETNLPWAINFGDGIYRHPTNLYEIAFLILTWFFIKKLDKSYQLENGSKFKVFMVLYLIYRFSSEFIKPVYKFSFGLSSIQIACILGLIYYYKILFSPKNLFIQLKN